MCSELKCIFADKSFPTPGPLLDLVRHLSQDPSPEVQSYVPEPFMIDDEPHDLHREALMNSTVNTRHRPKHTSKSSTFSRPPPPAQSHSDRNFSEREVMAAMMTREQHKTPFSVGPDTGTRLL